MINHHPKIVTSGLVLNVDPANPKSYPAKDDPYVGNVRLLLPFDGANGSTSTSDMSLNNFTVTANGNAQISTAQSKFGGSSAAFDGNGDYFSLAANAAWSLGTTWTVEAWIYPNTTSAGKPISTRGATFGNMWEVFSFFNGIWYIEGYGSNNTGGLKGSTNTYSAAQWYHLAAVTTGGSTKIYVNGVLDYTYNNNYTWATDKALTIGGSLAYSEWFNGYIDDVRITSAARYTANFTPPTRLTALPGRIYDLTTNKGTGSFVGSGVSYSSTNAGIVTLDGSNGYGVLPNTLTVGPTSTFTLCAWVNYISRPTAGAARRSVLYQSVNTNDFESILGFPYTYSASKMGLEVGKAGVQSQTAFSTYTNNLNEWYYLTGLFKNGSADFYINGVYQSTVTYNATINSATANTKNWGIGGVFFNGSITSPYANCRVGPIQVYNRNLTPSEITQNYNAAKGRFGL